MTAIHYTDFYDKNMNLIERRVVNPVGAISDPTPTHVFPDDDETPYDYYDSTYGLGSIVNWINLLVTMPNTVVAVWCPSPAVQHALLDDQVSDHSLIGNFPGTLAPKLLHHAPKRSLLYPNGSEVYIENASSQPYFTQPENFYDASCFIGARQIVPDPDSAIRNVYTPIYCNGNSLGLIYWT